MKVETQERIWLIWERMLTQVCVDQPHAKAIAEVRRLLVGVVAASEIVGTKEAVFALLSSLAEPLPEHIDIAEGMAPHVGSILQSLIRKNLMGSLQRIAPPPGGRPVKRTLAEREQIPKLILAEIDAGLSESDAKRRVARQTGLHNKMVDRIWAQRKMSSAAKMTRQDAEHLFHTLIGHLRDDSGQDSPLLSAISSINRSQ
jgi:hypothetical protein